MSCGSYILGGPEGKTPILEPDIMRWAAWFEGADRCVALTGNAERRVSTVFLGLDHNFSGARGGPVLFETMVFGGAHEDGCERYTTWAEAESGHRRWSALVFGTTSVEA